MNRDFAYKGRTGKGAVQANKKYVFTWSRQLLLVIVAFVFVVLLFAYLSSGKRDIVQPEQQIPAVLPEPQTESQPKSQTQEVEKQPNPQVIETEIDLDIDIESTEAEQPEEPVQGTLPDIADASEDAVDSLQFYNFLREPLQDDYSPDSEPEEQVAYRVKSGLIRNKVNARSLKALLVFDGFNNVRIDKVNWNNQPWYKLVVEPIRSRSRMNAVRDFFGAHDLESEYRKIK